MPDGPYGRTGRPGQTAAERQAVREEDAFGQTPEGARIRQLEAKNAQLERRLSAIENILNNLQGANGIKVDLPVISFSEQRRTPVPQIQVTTEEFDICDEDDEVTTITVVTGVTAVSDIDVT